jgi:hypothetical protein
LNRFLFPFAKLDPQPGVHVPIARVFVDRELGSEGFTYVLESNQDPHHLRDLLLYKLTVEAQQRARASRLTRREIIRRLGTSVDQLRLIV